MTQVLDVHVFWDAQGWVWGLEVAPGHLWVVLVAISMTIKSLVNICAVSSQVWGAALGFIDINSLTFIDKCIWSGVSSSFREQLSSCLGRAVLGLLPKPPQQALPAQSRCSCARPWLQSQPSSGVSQDHRNLLSWSTPSIALPLEMGFGAGDSLGEVPACFQGQSRADPPCAGAAFELKVLRSALELLFWEEAWAVKPEGV